MAKKIAHQKQKHKQPSHPFEVGQSYRNRDGEYRVISITEPDMVIRYRNGREIESPIALQARIWENMQEDDGYELELESH